jgi:hypothetical protein
VAFIYHFGKDIDPVIIFIWKVSARLLKKQNVIEELKTRENVVFLLCWIKISFSPG